MSFLHVKNIKIAGISAAVPKEVEENISLHLFKNNEAAAFIESTGVERRHISKKHTTSDLCYSAAEKLIQDLKWEKDKIDALILVTQSPDYFLPASSCIIQDRLGLSQECYALDVSLGCSGWIYGVSLITSLLSSGEMKRGILLAGDTSHIQSFEDKSAYPLFGEAGSATAFEYKEGEKGFKFHFSTDGSGYEAIIIPDGGFRNPFNEKSLEIIEIEPGIKRNRLHTVLNGMDVFAFGISKAPQTINKLLSRFEISKDEVDYFVFHQANKFMNEKIRKKLNIDSQKVPYSLKDFGNTSSASIPLTFVTELEFLLDNSCSIICCGFGVGLSWGSVFFNTEEIVISKLIQI